MTNSSKNYDTLTNLAASQEGALILAIVISVPVCLPMYNFVYYTGMNRQICCTGGLPVLAFFSHVWLMLCIKYTMDERDKSQNNKLLAILFRDARQSGAIPALLVHVAKLLL